MTDPTADLLPVGLEDRLPASARALTRARRAALDAMDAHGYDRVIPPLIEFEKSMATRMSGVATRRMFRFVDPASLRTLALRSDITVQVGRIAATSMAGSPRPLRLCYAGEVAVIRADQLDPARQKLQLGAELIGSDSAEAAGEVVALAVEALAAAGASGISVDFTLPDLDGVPRSLGTSAIFSGCSGKYSTLTCMPGLKSSTNERETSFSPFTNCPEGVLMTIGRL